MPGTRRALIVLQPLLLAVPVLFCRSAVAQSVWSGLTETFTKISGSDHTLPQNQDKLTDNVILARANFGGIMNLIEESSYTHGTSPIGTLWATDINNPGKTIAATNWQNLTWTNWMAAYNSDHNMGANIANRDAVVYLVEDNIYLDLRFTAWTQGSAGNGYSYMRAVPPTGDYNQNGVVDGADYVVWRNTLGHPASSGSGADGNGNETIDAGDYTYWRERFGNLVGNSAGAVPLPEPAAAVLQISWLLTFAWRSKRTTVRGET